MKPWCRSCWRWWFRKWYHPSLDSSKKEINNYPSILHNLSANKMIFHIQLLICMVFYMYHSSNFIWNAIWHKLIVHTPRAPYTICNYFTNSTHILHIRPYILSHVVHVFIANVPPLPPKTISFKRCSIHCPL
jgi:hypothetical protein